MFILIILISGIMDQLCAQLLRQGQCTLVSQAVLTQKIINALVESVLIPLWCYFHL